MAASRRSARLSAAASVKPAAKEAPPAMPPPPVTTANMSRKRKAPARDEEPGAEPPSAPATPRKRSGRKSAADAASPVPPQPATPTPSAVGLISEPGKKAPTTPRHKAVTRVADPRGTNAPLLSPSTSRVISSSHQPIDLISPSKAAVFGKGITTANLLNEACAHLIKVDPRMKRLVDAHHCHMFSAEGLAEEIDPFESLASGIISQQVSGAAARSIKAKFVALFHGEDGALGPPTGKRRFPHPALVADTPLERLRTAGLSQRKAEYVQGLASKFATGELTAQVLADAPYEAVLEKLIAVRGLGRWSVEMFACFGLKRMDVFSLGDLGVQRGMAAFVGRDVAKLKTSKAGKWKYMNEKDMVELSDRFSPYRSLFMWYMWRVEETDVSTME